MINWHGQRAKKVVSDIPRLAYFAIGLVNNVQHWPQDPYFPFSSLYNVVLHGVEVKEPYFPCSSQVLHLHVKFSGGIQIIL